MRVEYNTTILDIVYDESGQPFSIRYKSNPTKEGVVYYYVLNAQGDVIGLLNASGELVVEYKYDPWGKLLETIIGVDETDSKYAAYNNMGLRNPLRYRGYIYDRDTGLYYLQSRYYDPAIGRFINADTYTTTDADGLLSTNMFAYCENNPIMGSDPTGEWVHIAIGAAIGTAVQYLSDVVGNIRAGKTGVDILKPSSPVKDYVAAAVSGAIASTGSGILEVMVTGAMGNVSGDLIRGNIRSTDDYISSATKGMLSNAFGFGVGKIAARIKVNQIKNMPRADRKIYLRDKLFCNTQADTNRNLKMFNNAPMEIIESRCRVFRYGVYSATSSTLFGGML